MLNWIGNSITSVGVSARISESAYPVSASLSPVPAPSDSGPSDYLAPVLVRAQIKSYYVEIASSNSSGVLDISTQRDKVSATWIF